MITLFKKTTKTDTIMKRSLLFLISATICLITFTSCGSDSESDPFEKQDKRYFYPKSLQFRSSNNLTETKEDWNFSYNSDKTIKSYTRKSTIKSGNLEIVEIEKGTLRYYYDWNNNRKIENRKTFSYNSKDLTTMLTYNDTIIETATFTGAYISSIEATGTRNEEGLEKPLSYITNLAYSGDFCTSAVYRDNSFEKSYSFNWKGNQLKEVNYDERSIAAQPDEVHSTYKYEYDNRELAVDYSFNTMAFVYNHLPEIYSAMGFLGKATPYKIQDETFSEYRIINNNTRPTQSIVKSYTIMDTHDNVIYNATSPNYTEYQYNFSSK